MKTQQEISSRVRLLDIAGEEEERRREEKKKDLLGFAGKY